MTLHKILLALALYLWAATASALDDQSILWVSWIKPRPGMERQFENGLKAHHDWRRENGDTWQWIVWRISSGQRSGTYAVGTFNHRWSDFQSAPVALIAARQNYLELIDPFVESANVHHYTYQKSLNTLRDDLPPRKFSVTEEFELLPGREADFVEAAARIREAIVQTGLPYYYEWYRLETGGPQPLYARVRLLWNWQELETDDAAVLNAVRQTFGERRAASIMAKFNGAIRTETNRYAELRPDLSYIPRPTEAE
jgi:hypothetical protein